MEAGAQARTKLDLALQPLATAGGAQLVRVIVSAFSGRVEDAARAVATQGGSILDRFSSIGAVTTIIQADQLTTLAADWRVRSLSSDGAVESAQYTSHAADGNGNGRGNGGGGTKTTTDPAPETVTDPAPAETTTDPAPDAEGGTQTIPGPSTDSPLMENLASNHLLNTLGVDGTPWDGVGVNVAVIDSGIGAFRETPFRGQFDFLGGANPSFNRWETASDPYGHGTHVAGLIANGGWQTGGLYRGVAPRADRLYSLRELDEHGVGRTSDVIRAIEWVLANQRRAEVDIINLSLGHPILEPADRDPLVRAVEAAVRDGIVVVISAGNYGHNRSTGEVGYAGIASPGNTPSAITVGAIDTFLTDTRRDDVVARYSSRGSTWYDGYAKPDVVAPGSSLTSTTSYTSSILQANPQLEVEKTFMSGVPHLRLSGTSMAAAVTTGVVARMLHAQTSTFGRGARLANGRRPVVADPRRLRNEHHQQ